MTKIKIPQNDTKLRNPNFYISVFLVIKKKQQQQQKMLRYFCIMVNRKFVRIKKIT